MIRFWLIWVQRRNSSLIRIRDCDRIYRYFGRLNGLPSGREPGFSPCFHPVGSLVFTFFTSVFALHEREKKTGTERKKNRFQRIQGNRADVQGHSPVQTGLLVHDRLLFLNDALATAIAMMAVYSKTVIGFTTGQFVLLYLVSTVSSIIGSFLLGFVTKRSALNTQSVLSPPL